MAAVVRFLLAFEHSLLPLLPLPPLLRPLPPLPLPPLPLPLLLLRPGRHPSLLHLPPHLFLQAICSRCWTSSTAAPSGHSQHSACNASASLLPSRSQSVLDLINRCCELDPAKRPTAKQVVLALEGGSATPTSPEVRGALV